MSLSSGSIRRSGWLLSTLGSESEKSLSERESTSQVYPPDSLQPTVGLNDNPSLQDSHAASAFADLVVCHHVKVHLHFHPQIDPFDPDLPTSLVKSLGRLINLMAAYTGQQP